MGAKNTYYSWLKQKDNNKKNNKTLTSYEKHIIEETKEKYPHLRHRQIQGVIQDQGVYLSYSSVYKHLK